MTGTGTENRPLDERTERADGEGSSEVGMEGPDGVAE
jgi:hypothetical protein